MSNANWHPVYIGTRDFVFVWSQTRLERVFVDSYIALIV